MKLTEEELDSWFLELPLDDKRDFYLKWQYPLYSLDDTVHPEWDNLFKCESNTPID